MPVGRQALLRRGHTVSFQSAQEWSVGAAAAADAVRMAFRRRASVNAYLTQAGVDTSIEVDEAIEVESSTAFNTRRKPPTIF